jgi:protein-serine/threonine kinase
MNGQLSVPQPHAESATRSPSISSSSVHSQDAKSSNLTPSIPEEPALPHEVSVAAPPKKPTMTHRLTRMFSHVKVPPDKDVKTHRDKVADSSASETESNGGNNSSWRPNPPSRQTSYDKRRQSSSEAERRGSVAGAKRDPKDPELCHRRFDLLPDGAHEHFLKSAKRQEKLSDMLRDMLGGKRREHDGRDDDQQLSLMSTWVDQLKHERERLAADKKGGPNATATLVQKYGKCQEIIGRGAFGIVRISHKADPKDSKNEQLYAVKEFRRRPQESPKKYQKRLTAEFCISSSLRHPNVIHTLDLLQDAKGDYCEVMEFCAGGDLYTLVLSAGKLEVAEADCYFKQLMCGVEYLHEMGVAHRDLKPENLLLTTRGSLKITDFGNGECFRMAWEKEAHMTAGLCGSAPYIAPEEYVEKEFDPRAVDVWATGVIYMAMRTGRHLWRVAKKDEDEFYERYLEGRRDEDGYQPIETLHRVSGSVAPVATSRLTAFPRLAVATSSIRYWTPIRPDASRRRKCSNRNGAGRFESARRAKKGFEECPSLLPDGVLDPATCGFLCVIPFPGMA